MDVPRLTGSFNTILIDEVVFAKATAVYGTGNGKLKLGSVIVSINEL